jgi:hypothetical protein
MDLATHQRILLGLVRSNYQVRTADDDYFHQVARSRDLEEARGNIFLWRVYVLERTCVLTVALLRQRQELTPLLQAFIRQRNISPFREYQPPAFLASLADHPDHLVISVSQFELALMKVREGDRDSHVVPWQVEPHGVLKCLAEDTPLDEPPVGAYIARIRHDLPFLFEIEAV